MEVMPTATKRSTDAAFAALSKPISYDDFCAKLSAKDRVNIERHVAACELEPDSRHAKVWKRVACSLMTLSPHAIKCNGQHSAQFYVPDGKYRMQVFALEDLRQGKITVYCSNVIDEAVAAKVIARHRSKDEPNTFPIVGSDEALNIEQLDGSTPSPAAFYKDMLGWNRRALRITLPIDATGVQVEAVEKVCAISAQKWITVPTPA
jgi:hypothetical protein